MDGGDQITELIESSGEPWRPLSRFIVSENPYVKHRSIGEILDLKMRKEKYSLEYAQCESANANSCCVFTLTARRLEFNRQQRSREWGPKRRRGCYSLPCFPGCGTTIER